jgi:Flp pilus assembly protein TadD
MATEQVINPIVVAIKGDRPEEAEHFARAALCGNSDDIDLLLLLALALQRQSRPKDALEPLARLTVLCPHDSGHWSNYATALHQTGDTGSARTAAEQAARWAPDEVDALERLAQWSMQLGAPNASSLALQRAITLQPDSCKLKIEAARARVACNDILAGDDLRAWRSWPPLPDDLRLDLAELLAETGEPWDALEILEQIESRTPTHWHAQLLLAKLSERVNQPDRAEAILDWVAAMGVATPETEWISREINVQRAQLALRAGDAALARQLLLSAEPADAKDSGYYFLLAKACDHLGATRPAMEALKTGHDLQVEALRATKPHLLAADAPLLPGVDERVEASDYRSWPRLRMPDAAQSPVFVVGFPRSGTTLLEQMFDAHPKLQSMDERPFLNILAGQLEHFGVTVPKDLGKLGQRDCDELRKGYVLLGCERIVRRWDARLVDKNPLNMLWLPMLHRLFPNAKIVLALRHPCDVIWSCYLQSFRSVALQAACISLEHAARAYVAAMRYWLYHVELFKPDVFVSRYEDLVTDPVAQTRKIAAFLDVENSEAMLSFAQRAKDKGFIKTPSYTQVIQPINTHAIGHWEQYRPFFATAQPVLQPKLEYWGYTIPKAHASAMEGT